MRWPACSDPSARPQSAHNKSLAAPSDVKPPDLPCDNSTDMMPTMQKVPCASPCFPGVPPASRAPCGARPTGARAGATWRRWETSACMDSTHASRAARAPTTSRHCTTHVLGRPLGTGRWEDRKYRKGELVKGSGQLCSNNVSTLAAKKKRLTTSRLMTAEAGATGSIAPSNTDQNMFSLYFARVAISGKFACQMVLRAGTDPAAPVPYRVGCHCSTSLFRMRAEG